MTQQNARDISLASCSCGRVPTLVPVLMVGTERFGGPRELVRAMARFIQSLAQSHASELETVFGVDSSQRCPQAGSPSGSPPSGKAPASRSPWSYAELDVLPQDVPQLLADSVRFWAKCMGLPGFAGSDAWRMVWGDTVRDGPADDPFDF